MRKATFALVVLLCCLTIDAQQYSNQSGRSYILAVNLTAQTATIGTTTLFTAPSQGLYRISYSLDTTTAGSAGTALLTIGWNNGAAQAVSTATAALSVLGATTCISPATCAPMILNLASGQNVTYATTVAGNIGGQYSLRLRAEALN